MSNELPAAWQPISEWKRTTSGRDVVMIVSPSDLPNEGNHLSRGHFSNGKWSTVDTMTIVEPTHFFVLAPLPGE